MISGILYNVVDMRLEDWWCVESAMLITFVISLIKLCSSSSILVLSDDYYRRHFNYVKWLEFCCKVKGRKILS